MASLSSPQPDGHGKAATQLAAAFLRRWRAAVRPLSGGTISWSELPRSVRTNRELRENLAARGWKTCDVRFWLIEVPLDLLHGLRLESFDDFYEDLIESDEAHDAATLLHGEPLEVWEDGAERRVVAQNYLEQLRSGGPAAVPPIVVDPRPFADLGDVDVLDGFHRLHAAREAAIASIRAYEVTSPEASAGATPPLAE